MCTRLLYAPHSHPCAPVYCMHRTLTHVHPFTVCTALSPMWKLAAVTALLKPSVSIAVELIHVVSVSWFVGPVFFRFFFFFFFFFNLFVNASMFWILFCYCFLIFFLFLFLISFLFPFLNAFSFAVFNFFSISNFFFPSLFLNSFRLLFNFFLLLFSNSFLLLFSIIYYCCFRHR
jgi:hypothetical protein